MLHQFRREADMADQNKQLEKIFARAWSDPGFKEKLIRQPRAVAQEYGIQLPPGLEVRVVENTPSLVHLVLPAKPAGKLLTDEQLDDVAGGMGATAHPKSDQAYAQG
jgi:nitrile hydratase alpha subunit